MGNFFGFDAWAPCGLASHGHIIRKWDDPSSFCDVERVNAALVWTAFGYLEYRIPVDPLFIGKRITKVKIELEISPHHMVRTHKALCLPPDIPASRITDDMSDVTFWVNGVEVGTQTVNLEDDRESAIYTPSWWRTLPYNGELMKISLNDGGCFINHRKTNPATGAEILALEERFLTLKSRRQARRGAHERHHGLRARIRQVSSGHPGEVLHRRLIRKFNNIIASRFSAGCTSGGILFCANRVKKGLTNTMCCI